MRQHSLKTGIVLRFALIVLAVVAAVSLASNLLIRRQFAQYVMQQQDARASELADHLAAQYDGTADGWNLDYVHGMGMYALNEGYILQLYDGDGASLWDAQNHDMALCHDIMADIEQRMQEQAPGVAGQFVTRRFVLQSGGAVVGTLDVSFYSPYYLNENAFEFLAALNRILLLVGAVALAGAALMGLLLADYIAGPIARTVELTRRISQGDYAARVHTGGKARELAELAHAVDQMAEALEQQETLRRRLTSDVAHELRTPIANVCSYLEMMLEQVWAPTRERLQSCYDELQRLSLLVSELERLRQVETENLALRREPVDLAALAATVAGQFATQLAEKRQSCTVQGRAAPVMADRDKLRQVLTNLVSNAVKYTGEGGHIGIAVRQEPDAAVLEVWDDGIGIPQGDHARIFERFYRADQSRSRKTGGAGIGLAIAKAIVQAHGGTIAVQSSPGQGSRFTVRLPQGEDAENIPTNIVGKC